MRILTGRYMRTYIRELDSARAARTAAWLVCLLALALPVRATTVTGKVVDANGNPYTGTVAAALLTSGPPTVGGHPVDTSSGLFALAGDGSFSITLTDTATISPPGSVWQFTACSLSVQIEPNVPRVMVCFNSTPLAITGASTDISAQLNSAAPSLGPRVFTGVTTLSSITPGSPGQFAVTGPTPPISIWRDPAQFDIRDKGAVGDEGVIGTDNYSAIQGEIDAALALTAAGNGGTGSQTVLCPSPTTAGWSGYRYSKPLMLHGNNLDFIGSGMKGCALSSLLFHGYSFFVGPGTAEGALAPPTTASLLTPVANGHALVLSSLGVSYPDLRDGGTLESLTNSSAFTIETTFNTTNAADGEIFAGAGAITDPTASSLGSSVNVFVLYRSGGNLGYLINGNAGGVFINKVTGTAITQSPAKHHVAMQLRAGNCELLYDGNRIDQTACAGTFIWPARAGLVVGPNISYFGSGGISTPSIDGAVDSFRVSNIARYTGATYTVPTAQFTPDVNTLILCNGDKNFNVFLGCDTNDNKPVYLPYHQNWGGLTKVSVSGITLSGGSGMGMFIAGCNGCPFERFQILGGYVGLWAEGSNTYQNTFREGNINTGLGARFNFMSGAIGGLTKFDHMNFPSNATIPVYYQTGSIKVDISTVSSNQGVKVGWIFDGSPSGSPGNMTVEFNTSGNDDEASNTARIATAGFKNVTTYVGHSNTWGISSNLPIILIDGGSKHTEHGPIYAVGAGAPSIYKIINPMAQPLLIVNPTITHSTVPLVDSVNQAIAVGTPGVCTNLIFCLKTDGTLQVGGSVGVKAGRLTSVGTVPTSCAVTGAGASGSCTALGTDSFSEVTISALGAGTAATGTLTITFSSALGATLALCSIRPASILGGNWDAKASFIQTSNGASSVTLNWDNNGAALAAGSSYDATAVCFGR